MHGAWFFKNIYIYVYTHTHRYMCLCVCLCVCVCVCVCMGATASVMLTLYSPMDCSRSGSSVRGILQARTLEGVALPPGDLPNPRIRPASLISHVMASRFSLLIVPPGKPIYIYVYIYIYIYIYIYMYIYIYPQTPLKIMA